MIWVWRLWTMFTSNVQSIATMSNTHELVTANCDTQEGNHWNFEKQRIPSLRTCFNWMCFKHKIFQFELFPNFPNINCMAWRIYKKISSSFISANALSLPIRLLNFSHRVQSWNFCEWMIWNSDRQRYFQVYFNAHSQCSGILMIHDLREWHLNYCLKHEIQIGIHKESQYLATKWKASNVNCDLIEIGREDKILKYVSKLN